jgi:phytoene dehydrogenase-like protein
MHRRGIKKGGGRVMLNAHVDEVILEGGRAAGVRLRGGGAVRASKAIVCNASLWDMQRLLPAAALAPSMRRAAEARAHLFARKPAIQTLATVASFLLASCNLSTSARAPVFPSLESLRCWP